MGLFFSSFLPRFDPFPGHCYEAEYLSGWKKPLKAYRPEGILPGCFNLGNAGKIIHDFAVGGHHLV